MKRILILAFVLILIAAGTAVFAQSAELEAWTLAFNNANSVAEQLIYIRNVVDGNLQGADTFYAMALTRLVTEMPNVTGQTNLDAADNMAAILTFQLGEYEHEESAANILHVATYFENPLVRTEALIALGKIGYEIGLPHVIQTLNDLNTQPQSNIDMRERAERLAFGAISSLEHYAAPEGYLPVYFASTGWYSERIRSHASTALVNIMSDPTEPLLEIVENTGYSYDVKYLALQTSENSQSSDSNKARVAVAALAEGWRQQGSNNHQRQILTQMRMLALNMIRRYRTQDEAVYPQLNRSYLNGATDERLAVLYALEALASEESVRLLSDYLNTIHQRRTSNTLTPVDEQLVRVIIPALGNTGSTNRSAARPILTLVQHSPEWTNMVRNLARDSLERIGN